MAETQLSAPVASAALAQLHASSLELRAPFSEPIKIVGRTRVAGTGSHPDRDDLCKGLAEGIRLELQRDAEERDDPWRIYVLSPKGPWLGYVAADINEAPARLMDAGKRVYAIVERVEIVQNWHKVWVALYMDD